MSQINQQTIYFQFIVKLAVLAYLSVFIRTTSGDNPCAVLNSNQSPYINNDPLIVKDGSVLGNLAEEYLATDRNKSWHVRATWRVSNGCELRTCQDTYLRGECRKTNAHALTNVWLSAECKCNKVCHCPSNFAKKSVCARAYLQPGGCNDCDAPYTELYPGSHDTFPDKWYSQVSNFLVRSGCKITVYEEEDQNGDADVISGPTLQNWSGRVGSYNCECSNNDDSSEEEDDLPPVAETLALPSGNVSIPSTLDDVITKLTEKNFKHSGLLAALSSMTHERSSKNVYLLVLGSTGSGKSSAINILLRKPNVTIAGAAKSTTSDILEYRIPLPVPQLGIDNSELRIIDTPGLGDTRGLSHDARFLATLDDYLSNHEELKTKIPNLVLIFHKFNDNRFDGEGASFVRMIRGLDSMRPRITDENYSNVLFVFSHFCSEGRNLQRNPTSRLMEFKQVVENFSFFPKPVLTAVIENEGRGNELLKRNGNYELPNKEHYPQNLLDKFDTITTRGQDKLGNAVVTTNMFTNQSADWKFKVAPIIHPMVNTIHIKVPKYLDILSSAMYHFNSSEVSISLSNAYSRMPTALKTQFPKALPNLQKYLSLKNIKSKSDVPQTSKDILELISGIEQNKAVTYLQEHGLNLRAPTFPSSTIVGYSYDITKNSFLSVSPFKLNNFQSSSTGFRLPSIISSTEQPPSYDTFSKFTSAQAYFQNITRSLLGESSRSKANSTKIFFAITNKLKDGYFVGDMKCQRTTNMRCFTVIRMYKTFQFTLQQPDTTSSHYDSTFVRQLQSLSPFNQSSYENVEKWNKFFNDFGTHVVTSAEVGGRIDVQFTIPNTINVDTAVKKVVKVLDFVDDPLNTLLSLKENPQSVFNESHEITHKFTFRGGNPAYHVSYFSKLSLEKASNIMKQWKQSLKFYPAVFPKEIVPLSQIVSQYFPVPQHNEISEKIETALGRLVSDTLKYVRPIEIPIVTTTTEDPREVEALLKQKEQVAKNLAELENKKKAQEEEAEMQRLHEIRFQRKKEQEDFERAVAERNRKKEETSNNERIEAERQLKREQEALERAKQQRQQEQQEFERHWNLQQQRKELEEAMQQFKL